MFTLMTWRKWFCNSIFSVPVFKMTTWLELVTFSLLFFSMFDLVLLSHTDYIPITPCSVNNEMSIKVQTSLFNNWFSLNGWRTLTWLFDFFSNISSLFWAVKVVVPRPGHQVADAQSVTDVFFSQMFKKTVKVLIKVS